ncbi:hypothetical protein MUN84_00260 [Hymenobacter sp. 5516J-16]|uniref:hypothetical protein n=1 Tax=Hymenobacter sp. 5516J-16 TaxID=2932253 RepID=UPI001FD1E0C6|nr:hypothetical protein [Hymenobacter sp. 5516J-16]UOQ77215.1 hypothetical protein MUN84_00260 [Hymenobacter sp. 5516J-16]
MTDKMQYSQTAYCQMALASASANLFFFKAPVLSNYYLGNDTYRFLWLRSFHRPVLLTLTQQAGGAMLRTQFLTKSATAPRLEQILFVPPTASQAETARLQQEFDAKRKDPKVQRELAEHNRPAEPLPQLETIHSITPRQWQQVEQLLATSSFQQLPPCESSTATDGAYWVFESHQANGYHMVFRHSPDKRDEFRKACEYLLELSSARKAERY